MAEIEDQFEDRIREYFYKKWQQSQQPSRRPYSTTTESSTNANKQYPRDGDISGLTQEAQTFLSSSRRTTGNANGFVTRRQDTIEKATKNQEVTQPIRPTLPARDPTPLTTEPDSELISTTSKRPPKPNAPPEDDKKETTEKTPKKMVLKGIKLNEDLEPVTDPFLYKRNNTADKALMQFTAYAREDQ